MAWQASEAGSDFPVEGSQHHLSVTTFLNAEIHPRVVAAEKHCKFIARVGAIKIREIERWLGTNCEPTIDHLLERKVALEREVARSTGERLHKPAFSWIRFRCYRNGFRGAPLSFT